ncbi:uncharacterized protein [Physcomitrium patens]|uniref:uncharacterized protein isoform X1 n=1 Tax=Physcomitrium patens TaxID=3218 RepID=UPI000D156C75|nr:uncharacterized protein LOC112282864 isoform X1 [Physcomitrium patens]XP_024376748.1 uncharacterized protein LOC112282864 isoform X1 [Physcomitrium patens]|eukprot:XP_024376747.1 uncharacterized protein LOC112282864 isoform X1 [Physcomitrella patens]
MDLLFRVTTVSPLNSRDQGRCYSHKVMASQMVAIQQFRCILLPTHASRFVQRIASSSSWMRVYADAGPSTNYVSGERTTSIRSRSCNLHTAREEIQGLGIKSCMYDGVRISSKWKSQPRGRKHNRNGGIARASMRLDPGGGKPDGENGIGRVVVNLAIAGGLTYLTITGKLGWLFDAFVSLWLFVVLVPIVGFVAFLWFADREIVSSSVSFYLYCPNCGNPFQVLEFTMKEEEEQFCPYCSQPFKLEGKQFVRDGPRFYGKAKGFREPSGQPGFGGAFGGSGQRKTSASDPSSDIDPAGVIVDIEAEVMDKD